VHHETVDSTTAAGDREPGVPVSGDRVALARAEEGLAPLLAPVGADPARRLALMRRWLERARVRAGDDGGDTAALALAEAEAEVDAWARFVLGEARVGGLPPRPLALEAHRACGGAAAWPGCFLDWEPPAAYIEAMRAAAPPAVPPEAPGPMREQSYVPWRLADLVQPFGQRLARVVTAS